MCICCEFRGWFYVAHLLTVTRLGALATLSRDAGEGQGGCVACAGTPGRSAVGWFTGSVLYVLIWWTVLFAVLPFGTRPVSDADAETGWRGVPERPLLLRKIIATTLVSAVVWAGAYALISSDWMSFRHGYFALHDR